MSNTRALRRLGIIGVASCGILACAGMLTADSTSARIEWLLGGLALSGGIIAATALSIRNEYRQCTELVEHAKRGFANNNLPPLDGTANSMLAAALVFDERLSIARHEMDLLHAIVSSMEQGIIAVDRSERLTLTNAPARAALNLDHKELSGWALWETCRNETLNHTIREALTTISPVHGEGTLTEFGGRDRFLEFRATPVIDEDGDVVGAVVVITDMSDLRRLERVRRDFVTNISHELKTPLTAIRGMVETVLDDSDMPNETRMRFLKRVLVQGERLSDLVADLLTLSRLESVTDAMDCRPLDLTTIIKTSAQQLLPSAKTKRITLRTNLNSDGSQVFGDGEFLRQVADNLIDNAIKYTPEEGLVDVSLDTIDSHRTLTVSDTGCGIAAADQERIFERFYRVDKARSRELGSTGLGLSIVKHIVHAHDGTIRVESSPGKGTTFIVRLPVHQV